MVVCKSLTKLEIAEIISKSCGLKKNKAVLIVNSLFEEIINYLANNTEVKLNKFGNFKIKNKKERYGRNPKTLKQAIIVARKVVTFKSNKSLNNVINQKKI